MPQRRRVRAPHAAGPLGGCNEGAAPPPPVSAGCFHSGARPVLRAFLALVEAELRRIQAGTSAPAREARCGDAVAHSRAEEAVIATRKRREHRLHQLPADAADAVCKTLVRLRTDLLFGATGALQCSLARARVRFGAKCGCDSCGIITCGLRGPLRAFARHHIVLPRHAGPRRLIPQWQLVCIQGALPAACLRRRHRSRRCRLLRRAATAPLRRARRRRQTRRQTRLASC